MVAGAWVIFAACGSSPDPHEPPDDEPVATEVITSMVDPADDPYFAAPWLDDRRLGQGG